MDILDQIFCVAHAMASRLQYYGEITVELPLRFGGSLCAFYEHVEDVLLLAELGFSFYQQVDP